MRKSKLTTERSLESLRQAESAATVVDIRRKLGEREMRLYRRSRDFTGVEASGLRELARLREEDRRPEQVVATHDSLADAPRDDLAERDWREMLSTIQVQINGGRGWAQRAQRVSARRARRTLAIHRTRSLKFNYAPLLRLLHELLRDRASASERRQFATRARES